MPRVADICFREAGRSYRFDAGDLELEPGDWVVARTLRGLELGRVRSQVRERPGSEAGPDLRSIERKAAPEDMRRAQENVAREREALDVAAEKIAQHDLPMKLIAAECSLDGGRIVIHFSAEHRVDFRTLVRDLAHSLHTRIELHQVGVRDEAKLRGGFGRCGRPLCCAAFLTDFDPVGIKMAKEQDLSLNPQKISGTCGRLMCCLNFEYAHYHEAKQCIPKVGSKVETDQGAGKIREINIMRNCVVIALEEGGTIELPCADAARHHPGCPHAAGAGPDAPPDKPQEPDRSRRRPRG